jgi:hypothetical protein
VISRNFVSRSELGAFEEVFVEYKVHEAFLRWTSSFLKLVEVPGVALSSSGNKTRAELVPSEIA